MPVRLPDALKDVDEEACSVIKKKDLLMLEEMLEDWLIFW